MNRFVKVIKNESSVTTLNVFKECVGLLSKKDVFKAKLIILSQICLNFLDLLGVALIGVIGAVTVSGIQSSSPGGKVQWVLDFTRLGELQFQYQVAVLGAAAAIVLITRTVSSVIVARRTLYFFSLRAATISSSLIKNLLTQPLMKVQEKSSQENLFSVTRGVQAVTLGVLASGVNLCADFSLLVIMFLALVVVDPVTAILLLMIFMSIALLSNHFLSPRAEKLGQIDTALNVESNEKILQAISTYRENYVRNRRVYLADEIGVVRKRLAYAQAETAFLPNVSKYLIESTLVIGAILVSGIQFIRLDAAHAIATLTIFLAAGSRIAPAFLRIQQGAIQIRNSIGAAKYSLDRIRDLQGRPNQFLHTEKRNSREFTPEVKVENIFFTYPESKEATINGVSLEISAGSLVALVGASGSGKSTVSDLLLGILTPDSGQVSISNLSPGVAIAQYPGCIGYVPQNITIIQGSFRDNLILGFDSSEFTDEDLLKVLETTSLREYVEMQPEGLDTPVGEAGAQLSGGQRQRLGIARALITEPKLIVLDEATSSLDAETEDSITRALISLKGDKTVVVIAHRLSTVREADQVIYFEDGRAVASGSFDEVRSKVPRFDKQAKLMGLK